MGRAYSMQRKYDKLIETFAVGLSGAHMEDTGADGRIILKHARETGCNDVNWIHLTQVRAQWKALVNIS
jgi:hypothetical protein